MADSTASDLLDPAASGMEDSVSAPFSAPSPAEVLMMLGKLHSPRWRQTYRPPGNAPPVEREQGALALGIIGTELLIAIQARDEQHTSQVLSDAALIEKTLGVSESLRARRQRLQGHAAANEWEASRREGDAARDEQIAALTGQRDADLATLVPIGAWFRTMEVEAGLATANTESTQPLLAINLAVLGWLDGELDRLGDGTQSSRSVARCRQAAGRLRRLCRGGEAEPRNRPAILEVLTDTVSRIAMP